ncbi:beta-glucosidase family protein [Asticcacaulis endophyticus]|uniref:Glycosyl hydrolase n=1 Tax=Asticcacaulis endophyticus TaxID=1395890 RepID=A0A918Q2F3_9CAUL|nr:glycoside hydrolase family 3 protein [Asticcacaulis endophyticus]GGZ29428.1 glycosyl hydrolase [Asticcacaulis endophyticus]
MRISIKLALLASAATLSFTLPAQAQTPAPAALAEPAQKPWLNANQSADARVEQLLKEMTQSEKFTLVFGHFASDGAWLNTRGDINGLNWSPPKESLHQSAGFVYGVPRLGIPHQWLTDAGVGVASQRGPNPRLRTVLPSGMLTAATWDRDLAFKGGAMIGKEARLSGFNVQLAGGVNLVREPRNGRNFEYGGEDPLLAGIMVGEQIRGIQSNNIISTVKHYSANAQETNRFTLSANMSDKAARESDLLAFQFAIEVGNPASVMCAYNRYNGVYACEHPYLLTEVLKTDWNYKGYVMSDWGATHSTIPAANAGMDQQSGYPFDKSNYFAGPLKEAVDNGFVKPERLDDMARRILWAMFNTGLFDKPIDQTTVSDANIDFAANAKVTQADAEGGIVLLKNERNLLPIAATAKKVVVIGGHADKGVLSGGGSSQVYGLGGNAVPDTSKYANEFPGPITYYPDAPLAGIRARTKAEVVFHDGKDVKAAAKAARGADVVIVFGSQWTGESFDAELKLDHGGDALIDAVARANSKTVVVLQTGGPVFMPWLPKVGAVVEAWYPGSSGGTALARVLTGEISPSGRLPVTFPASLSQLPRPKLDGDNSKPDLRVDVNYDIEGAAIGYKWFDLKGHKPLFAFGHGLSYSTFAYSDLKASNANGKLSVSFTVTNTGKVEAADVPQVYVSPTTAKWEAPKRLGGWDKVNLTPGSSKTLTVTVDPRLLGSYDTPSKTWKIAAGDYKVSLAKSATDAGQSVTVTLPERTLNVQGK